jgi:serine/threonine-protein kinase
MALSGATESVPCTGAEQTPALGGMERGVAGSTYAALRWARLTREPVAGWAELALRELATENQAGSRHLIRPRPGGKAPATSEPHPGWRDGSAGMVHLWTLAHEYYHHEARFLDLAINAARSAFESSDDEPSLCQGLTGRAYALLACYRCTGDSQWRARAEQLADRALRFADPSSGDVLSLHHGGIGVLLLRAELDHPVRARMPMFEDEGWQASTSLSDALA